MSHPADKAIRRSTLRRTKVRPLSGESSEEVPAHPLIPVWDPNISRRGLVSEIVKSCGATASDASESQSRDYANCYGVALVAVGDLQSQALLPSLDVVRDLKRRGFKVVCYADQILAWPLAMRCKVLLAGATLLLDSVAPAFSAELAQTLTRLITTDVQERRDEESLRQQMRELGIVGESEQMVAVFRWLVRVSALSDLAVLIHGETGTGKELIANAVHRLDPKRRHGPFIVANCSAITAGLAESEFFGHRRGAFTGAENERKGLFRSAHGGVLFLDEINELDESLQAKLLRALQEKRVLGVGFDQEITVDVRVIAATNKSLEQLVKRGEFREDLYHRLNIVSVEIPPLRDRPNDFVPLIEYFLNKYRSLHTHANANGVNEDFLEAVMHLSLPGNVRQLENIVRCALLNKIEDRPLGLSDLPSAFWEELSADTADAKRAPLLSEAEVDPQLHFRSILDLNSWSLHKSLDYCEKLLLQCALVSAHGNQSQTARLIGITPRSVYNKLQKHKLNS